METVLNNRRDNRSIAIKGDKGAVEFHWSAPSPIPGYHYDFSGGIEKHSREPLYEGHNSLQEYKQKRCQEKGITYDRANDICALTEGECWCNGTSLGACRLAEIYDITNEDTIESLEKKEVLQYVISHLEGYYKDWFGG